MSLLSKGIIVFVVAAIVGLVPFYFPVNQIVWWILYGSAVSSAFLVTFSLHQMRLDAARRAQEHQPEGQKEGFPLK